MGGWTWRVRGVVCVQGGGWGHVLGSVECLHGGLEFQIYVTKIYYLHRIPFVRILSHAHASMVLNVIVILK